MTETPTKSTVTHRESKDLTLIRMRIKPQQKLKIIIFSLAATPTQLTCHQPTKITTKVLRLVAVSRPVCSKLEK
jgi:hypothetical protein